MASAVLAHPGQHDQLERINRHIAQAPTEQALFLQRGAIYAEGGQYERALADYRRAEELGLPVLVAFDLGVLHYRMGEYERANGYLVDYVQQFPNHAPAHDYLARVARQMGEYDRAIANLEIYFRLQHNPNPGLYLSAAKTLEESGRYSEALIFLDQGIARLGVIPQLQRYAIGLELKRQQPVLAIERLETLRQMLRESPDWQLEMAELLVTVERREEATALAVAAQLQLDGLRSTPARKHLQQHAVELIARLEHEVQQEDSGSSDVMEEVTAGQRRVP
jgi:tetratricopeptide (TPR) repeat protein